MFLQAMSLHALSLRAFLQRIQRSKTIILTLACALFFTLPAHADSKTLKMATTTSTYHSGLLDYLLPKFKQQTGYEVQLLVTGSGKALKMGEMGDVDIVLTHSPKAEKAFLDSNFGVDPHAVMYNDFIIVGPKNNPAKLTDADNAAQALQKIADSKSVFISRGDDSGTNKKSWRCGQSIIPRTTGQTIAQLVKAWDRLLI